MNTDTQNFSLSVEDKQQYAVLKSICETISASHLPKSNLTTSANAFQSKGDSHYAIETDSQINECKWTLHIAMSSPSIALLEELINQISPELEKAPIHVHLCSDWNAGNIGFVLAISDELATRLKGSTSIADAASAFCANIALLKNAPKLHQPGLLVMDMDSTVIAIECIDEIAVLAGVGDKVAEVTERAMQGELDFAESLRSRVACLEGLAVDELNKVKRALPLMPGLTKLTTRLKTNGWRIAIASGGFTYYADHLQQRLGLDAAIANVLEIAEEKLTGKVVGDIVDANVKADTVENLSEQWSIANSQTIAMGDGANDLKMMAAAQLGIAYKAKPIVKASADSGVAYGGLEQALFFLR